SFHRQRLEDLFNGLMMRCAMNGLLGDKGFYILAQFRVFDKGQGITQGAAKKLFALGEQVMKSIAPVATKGIFCNPQQLLGSSPINRNLTRCNAIAGFRSRYVHGLSHSKAAPYFERLIGY